MEYSVELLEIQKLVLSGILDQIFSTVTSIPITIFINYILNSKPSFCEIPAFGTILLIGHWKYKEYSRFQR